MQLSRAEFEQGLCDWLNKSEDRPHKDTSSAVQQICARDWRAKREPFTGHVWLERLTKGVIGPHDASSSTEADTEAEQEQLEFQDEAVYSPPFGSKDVRTADVFSIDLYVAYSPVYRVPVLYFRGRKADGSLVPLECLMKSSFFYVGVSEYPLNTLNDGTDEPANTTEEREAAHFPAISQAEHPQTGLPCFYLHPCETSAALQDVLSNEQDNRFTPLQFIETWFMLISTLLDIR